MMATSTQSNKTDWEYNMLILWFISGLIWCVGRLREALSLQAAANEAKRIFNLPPTPDSVVHVLVDEDGNVHRGIN